MPGDYDQCSVISVRFPYKNAIPRDVAINNFAIGHSVLPEGPEMLEFVQHAINGVYRFYNEEKEATPGSDLMFNMAAYVNRDEIQVRHRLVDWDHPGRFLVDWDSDWIYSQNLPDSPTDDWRPSGDDSSNVGWPGEVAVCLSFKALSGTSPAVPSATVRPRARERGRIYFGPLIEGGRAGSITGDLGPEYPGPSQTFREWLVHSGGELESWVGEWDTGHLSVAHWSVWSRADNAVYKVFQAWADNEYDIQRRRGVDAALRYTLNV